MPHDLLQGSGGDTFLDAGHSKGVPQYMRGDGSADMRPISYPFDEALNCPHSDTYIFMQAQVSFE